MMSASIKEHFFIQGSYSYNWKAMLSIFLMPLYDYCYLIYVYVIYAWCH